MLLKVLPHRLSKGEPKKLIFNLNENNDTYVQNSTNYNDWSIKTTIKINSDLQTALDLNIEKIEDTVGTSCLLSL